MAFDHTLLAERMAELTWHRAYAAGRHEFAVSTDSDLAADMWQIMRSAIAHAGEDRPFVRGNTRQVWRYLDLPDGYTYWVMRQWISPPPGWVYDPTEGYVLNRKRQGTE